MAEGAGGGGEELIKKSVGVYMTQEEFRPSLMI